MQLLVSVRNKYVLKGNERTYLPVNKMQREKPELLFKNAFGDKLAKMDKIIKPNSVVEISIDGKKVSLYTRRNTQLEDQSTII